MKKAILKGFVSFGLFALAMGGAFVTTSMGDADLTTETGFRHTGIVADPCDDSIQCSTLETSDYCKVGAQQTRLYGMDAPNVCPRELWKIE